jgi:hypothetical protein
MKRDNGDYGVSLVGDEVLPKDTDWVFIEMGGEVYFLAKASRVSPAVLADAWAGYRLLEDCG